MKNRNAVIYAAGWGATIVLTIVDLLWARRAGIGIGQGWPKSAITEISIAFVASAILYWLASLDRYRWLTQAFRCKEVAAAIVYLITIAVWGQAVSIASYLGTSLDIPTIASILDRFDTAIGFHWLDAYRWVAAHHSLRIVLAYAYLSAFAQFFLIGALLAIARRPNDIAEFAVVIFVSSILLLLVSIPFPAESAFVYYGITDPGTSSTVSDFALLRNGTMHVINPYAVQGLVSMPSFHTMLAIFFAYSVRHVRFVFPVAIILNGVMIASTITVGGHYLVDVFAGVVCGVAVILAVRLGLRRRSSERGAVGWPSPASDTDGSSAAAR
ncbi:phosphatase PAP2 family protein [Burkholderia cepacia]|uniref:phosphatase PAP2 family protein n=1 Tax=Burkholderia cepacia TaxID=292 RepID=UPI00249EF52D|nr:phosphatase PAP2 family protein [Burkholderia cepacia]WGY69870.1 phosphatase PAP2 family protein [Burkholderia cepacia]